MNEKQFKELIQVIRSLENKLDTLVTVTKRSVPKLTVSGEEKNILKLCNKQNSIDDMISKTGKTRNNIKVTLTHLRKKGLIKSVKMKGKLVYVKL